jgi:3-isopropylmalate dehydrogenase
MKALIAVLPGDGIGPEVTEQALGVLDAVEERFGHAFTTREALLGGCAIDATGTALPEETLAVCREADAVLLGAVGGPRWDDPEARVRPEQGLLGLRKALGLFANLRPIRVDPAMFAVSPLKAELLQGVDLLVVRELTGGIYFGEKKRERLEDGSEWAFDGCAYTTEEVERVVRAAAELARGRRGKLTSVDKANVLETSRLWRSVTTRLLREEYADLEVEHILVDACAMHLIRRPADFDVIVTENLFGDVLTDEASMLAGSMGLLPSASLGRAIEGRSTRPGVYEPIHGSAPDIAGRGIANPLGAILSLALLLRYSLGLAEEAAAVEAAVAQVIGKGHRTRDIALPGEAWEESAAIGAAVAEAVAHGRSASTGAGAR